ncbi:hypothetical protein ACF0H5_001399 [Mactra antiquata]
MENLQDMLLEHMVPDQTGQVGKVTYSFTEMKIVHVHWPKVSNVDGLFVANNGALRLIGKYLLHRPGVLGYNKTGEFIFDLGAICLSIRDNSSEDSQSRQRHHQGSRQQQQPQNVTCTVGHIKVKFHGGAARVCQFLTSLYIKVYRRHLEAQIAKVVQETVKDDGQILMSALSVMATMHGVDDSSAQNQTSNRNGSTVQRSQNSSESEGGAIQRFFDSFSRSSQPT